MNKIFWGNNYISAFTDLPCAEPHRHWMLQLFMCLNSEVQIEIKTNKIISNCIILDSNVDHSFYIKEDIYYTMLIDPTADIAFYMRDHYIDKAKGYGIININKLENSNFSSLFKNMEMSEYKKFIEDFNNKVIINKNYRSLIDKRIQEIITILEQSNMLDISIKELSSMVNLSESRLTHLFKEYTGIPLKGYILMKKWKKAYEYMFKSDNITNAALDAGFNSSSHFASTNRKLTGTKAQFIKKDSRFLKVFDV